MISFTALTDQADSVSHRGCYFALVLDTQCNGATIVSENVFVNPSTSASSVLPQPMRNLQNSKRYRVLASQYVPPLGAYSSTDGANTASIIPQSTPVVNLSWKGTIAVETDGTTANVTSVTDNAVHVIAYAGSNQFTPVFNGKSRVRFLG